MDSFVLSAALEERGWTRNSPMRFSLKRTFVAVGVIAAGFYGWIRWPTIAATSFVAKSDIDPTSVMMQFDAPEDRQLWISDFVKTSQSSKYTLKPTNRSFLDALLGIQSFDFGPYDIVAKRGRVTVCGPYWDFGAGKMRR